MKAPSPALIAVAIGIAGAFLYLRALDYVPPYLIHDEAQGALQAHAIATTAHDLTGRLLPLYFTEPEFLPGRDPALIYTTAIGLQVLPFSEAGARTPTTLVAVANVVLMFVAARAVFQSTWAGVIAALMLMLSPVHFIRGRLMLSPLYSIPFVLAWLWSLARLVEQPTPRRLVTTCAWLALGMYSYLAAVVMMPLYLLMTLAVVIRRFKWKGIALSAVTLAVCLLPMVLWYATHPERNTQIVSAYQLGTNATGSRFEAINAMLSRYVHLYWSFFDPAYLFVTGDASLVNSTRTAGLFPLAFAILVPIGMIALVRSRQSLHWIVAGGFVVAPLVSVISGAIEMNRVMFAIPFTVLAATYGAMVLWRQAAMMPKALAIMLVISVGWQFTGFHRSYMSEAYRMTAAPWFSGNTREALRELLARSGDSPIYISQEIEWVHRMWRFYAIEAGRMDVLPRTTYFHELSDAVPPNAIVICPVDAKGCAAIAASPGWRNVITVPSIDGGHRYVIFERAPAREHAN